MLIMFQMPSATHVAGFNTWKSLRRYVKKGEKGITILAPIVCHKKRQEEAEDYQQEQTVLAGVKPVFVFDVSQTEGEPLPEFATISGDPKGHTDRLKAYVAELGITLEYSTDIAPARGISTGKKIVLLPNLTSAEEFSTLVHELAHSLLHRSERRSETTRTIRETEAEAVAFVVSHAVGLDSVEASSAYIQLWHGDKATLTESLHHIQQVASRVLAAIGPGE
jgi:hypothetical protein